MYNRASADPAGNPWPKEARLAQELSGGKSKGYIYFDAAADGGKDAQGSPITGKWVGMDVPDFPTTKKPDTAAKPNGVGLDYHDGASPFIMKGDGKGWLFVPSGLLDGPIPTHYEPYESPVPNLLYPDVGYGPATLTWDRPDNPNHPTGDPRYPCVATTFRLTEHHTAGGMSRTLPWLAELQPEMFAEIDPVLAAQRGIEDGGWMVIETARAEIEARARVTGRMRPLRVDGQDIHQVGLPWHWGFGMLSSGDSANDLGVIAADPNVSIQVDKAFTCNVRSGRRVGQTTERLKDVHADSHAEPAHDAPSEDTATS
jgi:formate dehydrogenase major subunit